MQPQAMVSCPWSLEISSTFDRNHPEGGGKESYRYAFSSSCNLGKGEKGRVCVCVCVLSMLACLSMCKLFCFYDHDSLFLFLFYGLYCPTEKWYIKLKQSIYFIYNDIQARGQRKKIGWFPANYVKLLGSSSARSTPDSSVTLSAVSHKLSISFPPTLF